MAWGEGGSGLSLNSHVHEAARGSGKEAIMGKLKVLFFEDFMLFGPSL